MKPNIAEIKSKVCTLCKGIKPSSEFYKNKSKPDGLHNVCIPCDVARNVKRKLAVQKADPVGTREYQRNYYVRPEVKERISKRKREYLKENPGLSRSIYENKKNSIQVKARREFSNAKQAGKITKPNKCEECGTIGYVEGHHEDYSKPLDVKWLCRSCHGKTRRKSG